MFLNVLVIINDLFNNENQFKTWDEMKISYRSSRPEVFCKKGVLRNFSKFTGKHLCQRLFFFKKESLAQVFSCEFCQISKNIFFYRTPLEISQNS